MTDDRQTDHATEKCVATSEIEPLVHLLYKSILVTLKLSMHWLNVCLYRDQSEVICVTSAKQN